ncbi:MULTISPECIES: sensor histidine kinase KdpD [unclassified Oceanobacter]|jgi:signal transduction histidine kinase|uniref:sensor histidine kinase n=1 Tax=unclassified Oceanobacter TaxID=2620260 RepID=UPI0026E3CBBD|nr:MULTISPECIES: HAMP domain-containing sensor histidine kinase [unclassified Oceanobacter]MDO6680856.1 HAMP domain-containing sensor histidine kinase [Oceanobacter sp. 5_MG-2023]MDP2504625.1 HAMP domain-containing sensor histidine kinase [Oceanobacter sp. 3_MG-2023]MDP2607744.1 HAMP domain-containing sensor histidine kinase [Oceanobacter sp. 1_MG-2023]MDP2611072.1 HAMP domain-containing sensor histidine kinase [Oceanobacter sp. 2_MG-2023]
MKFDYMIGAVIHDLKNQLQTLLACEQEALTHIPERYHAYLKPILQNTSRLQNDAIQMMTLFRMEKERDFPLDDAWPHDTVLDAIDSTQLQFPNIRFENNIDEAIQGFYSEDLVHMALVTLITNSAQAGATRIRLSAAIESGNNTLVFRVEDNGHGFDQSILNGERITTKNGGSGLGLYLIGEIARHHKQGEQQGRVSCGNLPKGGAEVCIVLPHIQH